MKNNFSDAIVTGNNLQNGMVAKKAPVKMHVAYINRTSNDKKENSDEAVSTRQRASVFCSSAGKYYINGIPILMSQENDAGIYDEETSGYY
jgi:hypothetical protein